MVSRVIQYVILITIASLHINLYAQERFTVSYKQAKLVTVLKDLNKKTGLSFVCDRKCLRYTMPVTLQAKNVDLHELLSIVFSAQPVDYMLIANRLAIVPRDISGKVTDKEGRPIAGVTVRADYQITHTDSTGEFTLRKAACTQSMLLFHARDSLAIPIRGRTSFNVVMKAAKSYQL